MEKEKYNHILLVRREDLIDFFRHSIIFPAASVQFSGDIGTFTKDIKKVLGVFQKTPMIDYSINYFILHVSTETKTLTKGVNIWDLVSIIPLDEDSARMGLSLSPEVKLSAPIFEEAFHEYQLSAAVANAEKGIENVAAIFEISDIWKSIKKVSKKSIKGYVTLISDESRAHKPKTIWDFLLTYSRIHTYPNDTRGAFLDTMSVVRNFTMGSTDMKDQKATTTGRLILAQEKPMYKTLVECLAASSSFVNAADKGYKDFWQIAPLYFILLNLLSNVSEDGEYVNGTPIKQFVESVKTHYSEAMLKPALFMVGLTLGQASTYKMLYAVKKSNLPFLVQ